VAQGRGKAWRDVPQLAMLVHNDLLFLGHRLLTLAFEASRQMARISV
jgi:hypothetical protein